jgi:hypothetical protein
MKKFMVALGIMALLLALVASAWASAFEDFNDEAEFFQQQYYDSLEYQLYNSISASSGTASAIIVNNSTNNTLLTQANCGNVITGNVMERAKADASGGAGGATGGAGAVGGSASVNLGDSTNGSVNVEASMSDVLNGYTGVGQNAQVIGIMNSQHNALSFSVGTVTTVVSQQ